LPDRTVLTRWLFVWGPAVALMVAIFSVSSVPHLDTSGSGVSDKTLHFWTYGVLGVLLVRALAGAAWAGVTTRVAVVAWCVAIGWGALDEVHQGLVPGREPSMFDWLADGGGAALGAAAVWLVAIVRQRGRAV